MAALLTMAHGGINLDAIAEWQVIRSTIVEVRFIGSTEMRRYGGVHAQALITALTKANNGQRHEIDELAVLQHRLLRRIAAYDDYVSKELGDLLAEADTLIERGEATLAGFDILEPEPTVESEVVQ